jgi:predicted metal-dependent peptidase
MTAEQLYEVVLEENKKKGKEDEGEGEGEEDNSDYEPGEENGEGQGQGKGKGAGTQPGDGSAGQGGDKEVDEEAAKKGIGDHSQWGDSDPDDAAQPVIKDITERVVAKTQGQGMGDYKSIIDQILRSKCNWRALLRYYVTSRVKAIKEATMKHRKRKTPPEVYLPGKIRMKGLDVLVVADTSGSMGKDEARAFFGELEGIIKQTQAVCRMIQCDDGVQADEVYKKGDWKKVGWKGGGGTDFHPLFKYVEEKKYHPYIMVFFTDGVASYPAKKPPYPVIWLSTGQKMSWGINIKLEL